MQSRSKKPRNQIAVQNKLTLWLRHHRYAIKNVLNSLSRGRWTVLTNSAILGLSLSLPLVLISVANHIDIFSDRLNLKTSSVVYLQLENTLQESDLEALRQRLNENPWVKEHTYISQKDILKRVLDRLELESSSELQTINPFFNTLSVVLKDGSVSSEDFREFLDQLSADDRIANIEWSNNTLSQQNGNIIDLFRRFTRVLSIIVLLSTLLVCGYMARNQIVRQQLEVEVIRYCGAEIPFIRRPFLYWGAVQGFTGALCAVAIVHVCFSFLIIPTDGQAISADQANFRQIFYWRELLATLIAGTTLGLVGAWIATRLHLLAISSTEIQPLNRA